MRRIAVLVAAGLLALGTMSAVASPAQASFYPVGCQADGLWIVGSYPANHDQDVFSCEFSPYYRYWKYSFTCEDGTHPVATLDGPKYNESQEFYFSSTRCVAD
jgi:hypothetical protein